MHVNTKPRRIALLSASCMMLYQAALFAEAPYIDPALDHNHFGPPDKLLFWTPEQQVAGYRNSDRIFWTRTIKAGDSAYPLPYERADLGEVRIELDESSMTVDEYFARQDPLRAIWSRQH